MAHKRNAQEAFAHQLSAFAVARQVKKQAPDEPKNLASSRAAEPNEASYDDDEPIKAAPSKSNVQLSSISTDAIREMGDKLEVTLQAKGFVTFVGEYDISVVKGLVTIHGSMLHPSSGSQRVYALSTAALPPIIAIKHGSVIRLSPIPSESRITRLQKCSPFFRGIGFADDGSERSFAVLHSSSDDILQRSLVSLEVEEDMRKVLSRVNARLDAKESPRIMAVGSKSSGKSTLNRFFCNVVTSRPDSQGCMYLDLDLGQPEFGPPGQISLVKVAAPLLGPSFTHLASTDSKAFSLVRAHTLAAVSFKDNPELFMRCVADLAKHIPKHLPLIVNSCGWVSGMGMTIIMELVTCLSLSDVPILHSIDSGLNEGLSAKVTTHNIRRRQGRTSLKSPAELRAMQTMAYFHSRYGSRDNGLGWTNKPINEMRPWIVRFDSEGSGIAAVLSYGQMPHPDFLSEVLDGAVVAIVVVDPEHPESAPTERTRAGDFPYTFSHADECSPYPDPRYSHCVGCALVRGIDTQRKKLQLVTPLAESQIARLRSKELLLVRGFFDSPDWAYLEGMQSDNKKSSLAGEDERPWISRSEPTGIEASVWRLRHPPMAIDVRNTQ